MRTLSLVLLLAATAALADPPQVELVIPIRAGFCRTEYRSTFTLADVAVLENGHVRAEARDNCAKVPFNRSCLPLFGTVEVCSDRVTVELKRENGRWAVRSRHFEGVRLGRAVPTFFERAIGRALSY